MYEGKSRIIVYGEERLKTKFGKYPKYTNVKRNRRLSKRNDLVCERESKNKISYLCNFRLWDGSGNNLVLINKLLCNPKLLPEHRICDKYKFYNGCHIKGRIKESQQIIEIISQDNSHKRHKKYNVWLDGEHVIKDMKRQSEVVYHLMEILNLPYDWDIESGSRRYTV